MKLVPFEKLPSEFRNDEVKVYYDILYNKRKKLIIKRILDIIVSLLLIVVLFIPMCIIAFLVKLSSKGPVFYKQERITTNGKKFKILKFRSMLVNSDQCGELLTKQNDERITGIGKFIRKYRLDELPQIYHVLSGKMSLVGTRPEVTKYVMQYTPVMYATLLMPPGITSLASILFKDEDKMLKDGMDIDKTYLEVILPKKMKYNLRYIKRFGLRRDLFLLARTALEVLGFNRKGAKKCEKSSK
ncbi:MAG: sugar transferase [Acutalibacteraceae bacterium]